MRPEVEREIDKIAASPSLPGRAAAHDLASEAFRSVAERASRQAAADPRDLLETVVDVIETERPHRARLERLAIEMIRKEFDCPPNLVAMEAKLKDVGEIDFRGVRIRSSGKPPRGYSPDVVTAEIEKRRTIDSMIHGAAQKVQNLFHIEDQILDRIDPDLKKSYSLLSAQNDLGYWQATETEIMKSFDQGLGAGVVRLDFSGPIPKIKAEAVSFPFLLHELGKGVMEVLALGGLPADKTLRKHVMEAADTMHGEVWDLRVGSTIWGKFITKLGPENRDIRNALFRELSAMPAAEFHVFMRSMLADDPSARARLAALVSKVERDQRAV